MKTNSLLTFSTAVLVLFVTNVDAREPTFDEMSEIHKVLQTDGCDYVYQGMGERQLFVNDAGFEAEATCNDKSTYTFNFDKSYKLLDKTVKVY